MYDGWCLMSDLYLHFALDIGYWFRERESSAAALMARVWIWIWMESEFVKDFYIFSSDHNWSLLSDKISSIKPCRSECSDDPSTGLLWWVTSSVLQSLDHWADCSTPGPDNNWGKSVARHTRSLSVAATNQDQDSHITPGQARPLYWQGRGPSSHHNSASPTNLAHNLHNLASAVFRA